MSKDGGDSESQAEVTPNMETDLGGDDINAENFQNSNMSVDIGIPGNKGADLYHKEPDSFKTPNISSVVNKGVSFLSELIEIDREIQKFDLPHPDFHASIPNQDNDSHVVDTALSNPEVAVSSRETVGHVPELIQGSNETNLRSTSPYQQKTWKRLVKHDQANIGSTAKVKVRRGREHMRIV